MEQVLYGIDYIEYYFYWIYYKFIGYPLIIRICSIAVMFCIIAYLFLLFHIIYGIFKRRKEKKKPKLRSEKEQNYISNAKMMLMQRNHLNEEDAYRYIQKSSMDSGTNMVETAQMLLMLLYES